MEVGLLPHRRPGEQPEGLYHAACRQFEAAGDAAALQDAAAPVRVRLAVGAAIAEAAIPHADRSEDLRSAPDVIA